MSDPVISVENLSKSYLIGHQGPRERYTSLRDTIAKHAKNFTRRTLETMRGKQMLQGDSVEEFWALKDVSFEVQQGEVLGIIGRNGAGKSTLLKVLSRITEPTSGRVTLTGRVASLLEVGTGFHPELTGRENLYLNGAILGMTRREITAKFDEIVDFAGVEKFLDTPVKRYSSGMYVRLAFAVAAHLEPEILIVDEVLAVGDAEFQKKCMGKMQDVAKGGRTVLFVSHNMTAVHDLCKTALLLGSGTILAYGPVEETSRKYLEQGILQLKKLQSESTGILESIKIDSISESPDRSGWIIIIKFCFSKSANPTGLGIDLIIKHQDTPVLFCSSSYFSNITFKKNSNESTCEIGPLNLAIGNYDIDVRVCEPMKSWLEEHDSVAGFQITRQTASKFSFLLEANRRLGYIIPNQKWS